MSLAILKKRQATDEELLAGVLPPPLLKRIINYDSPPATGRLYLT
jgi:hypothetical protein